MSEKRLKFERLAEKRVTDTIKKMRLVGNLANKNNYDYTDVHVKQIIDALENELRLLKIRFKEGTTSENCTFEFKKQ
ncbi:MAG: hypothetical protein GX660_27810 [Clostridiaceae bacterium]|nr:hypothetical protein [Clostridiaceae bacterium]